jgi:hypothetical protein
VSEQRGHHLVGGASRPVGGAEAQGDVVDTGVGEQAQSDEVVRDPGRGRPSGATMAPA